LSRAESSSSIVFPLFQDFFSKAVCPPLAVKPGVGDHTFFPYTAEHGQIAPEHAGKPDHKTPDGSENKALDSMTVFMNQKIVLCNGQKRFRQEYETAECPSALKSPPSDSGKNGTMINAVFFSEAAEKPECASQILRKPPCKLQQIIPKLHRHLHEDIAIVSKLSYHNYE